MATVRQDQKVLTYAQRKAFTDAVITLKKKGLYDPFVKTHLEYMGLDQDNGPRVAHRAPSFLPWHRQFLLMFEQALQAINKNVSLPYWNWTASRAKNAPPFTPDFMGGDGQGGDREVPNGPFAYSKQNWPLNERIDSRPFLRRVMGVDATSLPTIDEVNLVLGLVPYDAAPYNSSSATGFRNRLEGWSGADLHNRVHDWVGGTMTGGDSPNDPVFWLHHCYIDKLWADWQAKHPGYGYLPAATTKNVIALNDPMPPWKTRKPSELIDHKPFYTYA
ncbi:tyrosinase family protein [Winogradskya humida]|uniref:Tyrosinase n=1 Tax=Winogradskya humida TaxID=113566 RepID=A0ABQ4A673_9ACTN|nr:tyrosinase family protein [Actinoplanes humidus]GIE26214.1 tyrosinase [Actinoplanes humidus]